MTPVEKLKAAVVKLEQMRAPIMDEMSEEPAPATQWLTWWEMGETNEGGWYPSDATAQGVFEILYRTIDPQLAMLRDALECDRPWKLGQVGYYQRELELADAILGVEA